MMVRNFLILATFFVAIFALNPNDYNSFSNPDECFLEHYKLELGIDFNEKILSGKMRATVLLSDDAKVCIFDTNALEIFSVKDIEGNELLFSLGEHKEHLGYPLIINLTEGLSDKFIFDIFYSTTTSTTSIQFLDPAQTAGGKLPYMFSQNQASHARSMFPSFDTPSHKVPWSASISIDSSLADQGVRPVMSTTNRGIKITKDLTSSDTTTFEFDQPLPVPSYLLAMAAGNLVSADVGPRSSAWSEPETIEAAAFEFEGLEDYIVAAEKLVFDYEWTVYDVLVLPPSFPYGGMENPAITFATPTMIDGARSLISLISHELAHSWFGNTVTNTNWNSFWINEGFCVWGERKILREVFGEERFGIEAIVGTSDLLRDVEDFGESSELTQLVIDLEGRDVEDGFSSVPYEKGFIFLMTLEEAVGGHDIFAPFISSWISEHKYQAVTADEFKAYFTSAFPDVSSTIDWDYWYYAPGMPPVPSWDDTLAIASYDLSSRWKVEGGCTDCTSTDIDDFFAIQTMVMLDDLLEADPALKADVVQSMGSIYSFADSDNFEIRFRFSLLSLNSAGSTLPPNIEEIYELMTIQGRMKFVLPLYTALNTIDHDIALELFLNHREFYHPLCASLIADIVGA